MATGPKKSKANPKKRARVALSAELIEHKALDLIEEHGLESCSQRSLARALGVEAMSLYHWHPSRLALLNAVLDRMFADMPLPQRGTPIERLREMAWSFRALALRYPRFFAHFALQHRFNTETMLGVLEQGVATCRQLARSDHDAALIFRSYVHFLMGALLDETAGYAGGPGAEHPISEAELRQRYPHVAALGPYNRPEHHEQNFRFGLELILQAFERGAPASAK